MEDTLKLIERTDRVLRDLEDEEVQRLNTALDSSYLELERELLRKYPNYTAESQPGLLATQRGVLLTQELSNVLSLVNPNREKEIQGRFERLLQTSSKEGTTLSQELMQLRGGDDFVKATATIPIEAVAFEVRDAIDRLKKHDQKFREDASVIISQGLIQGWGAKRTATQLRQQLGVAKGRAETIARTEVLAAQNSAAQQSFKDNGIQFFQFIATLDDRSCPTCLARHGNVYKLGDSQPPLHPRCRCFSAPFLPERDADGTQDNEWIKRTREEATKLLRESGKELNEGRSPFELAAGILAPKPVWSPGDGWIDKDVERTAQNHALALLVLALLIAPKPQPPGLPPIIPIPIPLPIPKPPEEEDNQLLKTLLIGAAIVGVSVGAYYIARTRYRDGFKQSARMAVDMIPDIDLEDIGNNDQITFIAGGFAGQAGQSGLEYAPFFSQILGGHHLIGVPNPSTDKAPPIGTDPLKHITTNWGGLLNTAIVEGRNPDAVRMAAMAAAHYRKYGKPVNLIGYSAGGLVASEAHEILKVMGVPVKTATLGTPWFGFTDLSPDEMIGIMGKGDQFAGLPVQNRVEIEDVESHWLDKYFNSPNFQTELQNWFGISKPSDQSTEPRKPQRVRVDVVDETLVDLYPQLQLLSEDEIRLLPAPIAQKVLAARRANLLLTGKADPLLLTGLPELLALPEAVSQIVGLLEGKPDLKMLPGVAELLALPGVKDQIRGLLKGRPDPKLLPSAKELLALPAVAEVRGLLTGRLEPKMLRGIPEPPLLEGLAPFLMLPEAQSAIKGLLRGEVPPLQLPAGIEVKFPQNEQALLLKQTTRQLYQQIRSTQRRFTREAERKIRVELQKIAAQDIPPMAKLQAYRQLMYEQLRAIAEPVTLQQAPGTKKPEDLVSFRFAGIEWHVPELKPTSPTLDTLRKLIELNLPDELVQAVDNVFISKQKGAYEEFWRKMLGLPIGPIPATVNFEDSSITAYRGRVKPEDMLRQMGFLLAEQIWGRLEPPRNSEYWLAIANEGRPITTYGFNSTAADFADGVAQFFLDPQRLKRFNPRRYDAIARILNYRHPESVVPPRPPDVRSPAIIGNLRSRNQEIRDQSQQQRQEADAIAQKQRGTKKVQTALTRITNEAELTAQSQNGYAQLRSQDEALDRLEVEVQGLEQRQAQLLNPLNNPYFTEVPPRLRAAKRQLKDVDKQLKAIDKVANAAAKVRANAVELQQTLSDLETRRESLKVTNQGQKVDAAVTQLQSTLQQAEQELTKLPQSPERSQALRDLIRLRAAINAQPGGVSVGQLHRDALLPRIGQISQLADELEGLQTRLTATRNKLSDLQTRLARLPQRVADLTPDQQAQYGAIKRTRVAQSKLPTRVENYRTIRQSYSEQLAERGQNTQKLADDYQGQRQSAVANVSSIVETRLQRIQDRLTILNSLRPDSIAWLMEARNWEMGEMPDDLAIVLANQPGRTRNEKLKAAADEIYRLVSETAGAADAIERRLNYPNDLADATIARVQADKQQWEQIRDALANEETITDEQIKKLLDDPTKIKPIDVIRYGNQLLKDLEQFQADFVTLLLNDDRTDPKTIINQADLYRQSRDRFSEELTQNRAQIAREIEDSLAIVNALEQRLQRDKAEPLIYDINGKARTLDEIRAELEQVKETLRQLTAIRQVKVDPKVNEYLNPERATERKQEFQAFERRQARFQELKDQLTVVNREIQKRREAAARGQKRGINTDRLEAEQRQIMNEVAQLAQEWTNDGADDGED